MEQINQFVAGLIILICCMNCASAAIDPPTNLNVDNLGSTDSLNATWTPPSGATSQTVIWYLAAASDTIVEWQVDVLGDDTSYLIENLTSGALYNVSVFATNATDDSTMEIVQGRPRPSPVTLSESGATNDSITAEWSKPSGTVQSYDITCTDGTAEPHTVMEQNDNSTYNASCVGLGTAGADYIITVISVSGNEMSDPDTEHITALPNMVDPMEGLSTVDSVSATWKKPAGEVDTYNINCSEGAPSGLSGNDSIGYSATCESLPTPGKEYTMTITSISNGKPNQRPISLRALPSPVSLSESDASTNSITAEWSKPNGIVHSYNVSCSSGTAEPPTVMEGNDNSTYNASCVGLGTAGADYSITVVSISDDKPSDPSTRTITAYPNSVALTLKDANSSHITVAWNHPGGVIDYFEVSCESDGSMINITDTSLPNYEVTCEVPTAGMSYNITVKSVSGDKSRSTTETFNASDPVSIAFNTMTSNTTAITVTWTSPSAVDNYLVNCSDGNPSPGYNISSSYEAASCLDVTPGGNHSITVVTVHNNGRSPETVAYIVAVPLAVNLTEAGANTTAITVGWIPPGGLVDSYQITCPDTKSPTRTIPFVDEMIVETCTVSEPGQTYNVKVVSSSYGENSSDADISITAVPEKAVNLTETYANTTAFTVTWDKADGMVDTYEVMCINGTPTPSMVPSTGTLVASCTNLDTPGATYQMEVVSVSKTKRSEAASLSVTAFPNSVKLTPGASTTSSVNASWEHPDGQVDSFQVFCGTNDTDPEEIKNVTTDQSYELTCENLTVAGDGYAVSVFSISGDKNSSAEIMLYTLPNEVMLERVPPTTTSVTASWERPDGIVENYTVSCSLGDPDGPNGPVGDLFRASCVNLPTPGDDYTMTVTSISNGQENAANIVLTALPSSVSLQQSVSTTTSVSATWEDPPGIEESYEVACSNGTVNQDEFRASCDGVWNPGDNYTMTVTSVSNGQRNGAEIVLTALPLSVTSQQNVSTTTSVSATWQYPGGIVEFYEVECSNGTVSQDEFRASCDGVWNPGDNYTMTVTSVSNGQRNGAEIELTALPLMAEGLMEANASTSSVMASWLKPMGVVEYYDITCPIGNATPPTVDPMTDPLESSCNGLEIPGDDYNIVVTSVSYGQRGEDASINITALPLAVMLNRGVSTTTSISASWMHPGGVVDTFDITCSNGTAEPPSYVVTEMNDPFTASCVNLSTPGETYTLSVVAYSNSKPSAVSAISDLALPAGVELREGISTTTSVSALWNRTNGIVQSYEIECDRGVANPSIINDTNADSYQVSCLDLLVPGDDYRMTVFSVVEGSKNSSSGIMLVAVPEAVATFTVDSYNTSSVTVSWTLKSCPSGCVYTRFEIEHDPDGNGSLSVDHEMDQNSYSRAISDLTPGRNFSFTIVSVSVGQDVEYVQPKISAPTMVTQRTEPASPTNVRVTDFTTTTINISWTKADGDVEDYTITLDPEEGTPTFNGDLDSPAARVEGLTSGVNYTISVRTVSGDLTSVSTNIRQRTDTSPSGPVGSPQANAINITTIEVTYEEPEEPNGIIERYQISYVGTREGKETFQDTVTTTELRYLFTGLTPGYSYVFTIIAFNDGGHEGMPATTEAVSTPEEPAPSVPRNYSYTDNTIVPVKNTYSLTVILPADLFSHENGEITSYDVIVSQYPQNDAGTVANVNISYQQAESLQENGIWPPYVTLKDEPYPYPLPAGSRRRKRATVLTTTGEVEIGTENPCPSSGYCNGRLRDNTQYYYAFRANNGGGSTPSGYFGPVITVKYVNVEAIVGSVVPITLLLIAGAIFGVFYFRKQRIPRGERVPPNGLENAAFIGEEMPRRPINRKAGSSMYKKSFSRPLHLNTFEEHYNMMKADSEYRFSEEYEEIRPVGRDQPTTSATLDMNRAKNRFTNILPYEHSRVKLLAIDDEEGSDYINANFMPGYNSPREFIAAQGPLPGTLDDMWRMIWEKKTSIIVMLTQLVEKGRVKCHQYWPADYKPIMYGSVEVSLQSEENFEHWIVREFTLVKDENKRKLTQFHFMSWPDHGVPQNTESMLSFVRTVRDHMPQNNKPVVVHCSAGVGRTGTYITLDRLTQHMQENDFIDIFGIICEMRMQRNYMVQTEKQYIFIHECVMDLIRSSAEYVNTIYDDVDGDVNDNVADEAV